MGKLCDSACVSAAPFTQILTRGDESGRIPPALFQRVVEIKSGRCLWLLGGTWVRVSGSGVAVMAA